MHDELQDFLDGPKAGLLVSLSVVLLFSSMSSEIAKWGHPLVFLQGLMWLIGTSVPEVCSFLMKIYVILSFLYVHSAASSPTTSEWWQL